MINFDDAYYGMITREAWDHRTTGQILDLVEHMLNDAHDLALRRKDE